MHLLAVTYDGRQQAESAFDRMKRAAGVADVDLFDAAVAVREPDGKIGIHRQIERNTAGGAVGGLFVGLLLAALFPPAWIAEVILGAVGGALGGYLSGHKDRGTFQQFVSHLAAGGASVVVLLEDDDDVDAIRHSLATDGEVTEVKLTPEESSRLRGSF